VKYAVFWAVLAATPALAWVLALSKRWIRWAFYGMLGGLALYEETSISFLSNEFYRGTSRGMEVSILYILALAVVLALALRGKRQPPFPEAGIRLYAVYFLLCLPSLWNADSVVIGWLEVWKMMMMFLCWHAVYGYLAATGDADAVIKALALVVFANTVAVVRQHYAFLLTQGIFPHRNGMAMAMNLLGPMFLAGYLQLGLKDRLGRMCAVAFACAALCGMWSYSRGATAVLPIGYGIAAGGCLLGTWRSPGAALGRLAPVLLAGLVGLASIWGHLVERFTGASSASGDTRIALNTCALEMMKDHPLAGVGINNWILNVWEDRPYMDRAEEKLQREIGDRGIVETVYLLVGAECGIPALAAMLAWFFWHGVACVKLSRSLRGTRWHFVAVGLAGGLAANYLQSTLEWVLRQQRTFFLLVFCFAVIAWLRTWKPEKEKAA
jgi:O-antigen ligase